MTQIISIHSFRRGTGKSTMTANIAALLAAEGRRVVVIDTNLESPSLHILFGLKEDQFNHTLNEFLWGQCKIQQTVHDVTPHLHDQLKGQILFIPASSDFGDVKRVLHDGYDAGLINFGCLELKEKLDLDVLLFDTQAGLNAETLASVAIANTLVIILRLDRQDFQGTSIIVDLAKQLDMPPRRVLVANEVPLTFNFATVKSELERVYQCEVAAILPHSQDLMALANTHIFALMYPDHPLTTSLKQTTAQLIA